MSRLKFELKKIRIDPLVHLRMLRHANEHYQEEPSGQLWGILYDQVAEVTNILPIVDTDDREENDASERRYEENLPKFNMDSEKLGWYCIEHKKNFWSGIEFCRLYEVPSSHTVGLHQDQLLPRVRLQRQPDGRQPLPSLPPQGQVRLQAELRLAGPD